MREISVSAMSLFVRRLLLCVVVVAVGFAGLPSHANAAGPIGHVHDEAPLAVEQDERHADVAHHGDAADVECVEVGHCSPVQLLLDHQAESSDLLRREAWSAPRDVFAGSLKPEASTPPPESA
jgi:hypothetical protein